MSRVLRHKADQCGIRVDPEGWVELTELRAKGRGLRELDESLLMAVVASDTKKRYATRRDPRTGALLVRANQGHSMPSVTAAAVPITPADIRSGRFKTAMHGTYWKHWDAIKVSGLQRMSRNHIHFSAGHPGDDGVYSARASTAELLIEVDIAAAMAEGIPFFVSENAVVLTPGPIPPRLFARVSDLKTRQTVFDAAELAAEVGASGGASAPGGSSSVADLEKLLETSSLSKAQRKNLKKKLAKARRREAGPVAVAAAAAAAAPAESAAVAAAAYGPAEPPGFVRPRRARSAEYEAALESPTASSIGTRPPAKKKPKAAAAGEAVPPSGGVAFDALCVLDFEGTCVDRPAKLLPQEVIEFPTVVLDGATGAPVAELAQYVKPVAHPVLSPFCTELTGIEQRQVDAAVEFGGAFAAHVAWMGGLGLGLDFPEGANPAAPGTRSFAYVTCGDWDLKTMLPQQLKLSFPPGHKCPAGLRRWINIKRPFTRLYGVKAKGMAGMLCHLNLPLLGRHHSGIDDCRNIGRIAARMIQDGWVPSAADLTHASTK